MSWTGTPVGRREHPSWPNWAGQSAWFLFWTANFEMYFSHKSPLVERGTFCHETLYLLKPLFKHSLTDELLLTSSERNHQNNSCRKFITFIKWHVGEKKCVRETGFLEPFTAKTVQHFAVLHYVKTGCSVPFPNSLCEFLMKTLKLKNENLGDALRIWNPLELQKVAKTSRQNGNSLKWDLDKNSEKNLLKTTKMGSHFIGRNLWSMKLFIS